MNIKISEDEARELTQQLIRIPSLNPPGNVDECALFIASWLNGNGIRSEMIRSEHVANVVAKIGDESGKKLLWNGHCDVVPAGGNWVHDPFSGFCENGFVYGRGASDMKGGNAAMMLALKALKEQGVELKGQIVLTIVGDEETGSVNGTIMVMNKLGIRFDGAIVAEPTDLYVERAQRGLRWIEIKVFGRACHAGRPHVGKNAIEYSSKVIEAFKRIPFTAHNEIFEQGAKDPSLSVTMISGGIKTNIIPEECSLMIDRRMIPGERERDVVAEIERALSEIREEGFSIRLEVVGKGWDPFITDQNEPIVKNIMDSYQRIMQEQPRVRGKGGCTDASHIFHAGIPAVIFGPGIPNESHTANEKVAISRVTKAAEIFADSAIHFLNNA